MSAPKSLRDAALVAVQRAFVRAAGVMAVVAVAQWTGAAVWQAPQPTWHATVVSSTP